jgi:hypothetical protein
VLQQVIERLYQGNLPFINEDSVVEFPSGGTSAGTQSSASLNKQMKEEVDYGQPPPVQETFATNLNKLPS